MKKKISESQLRKIVSESIKKFLIREYNDNGYELVSIDGMADGSQWYDDAYDWYDVPDDEDDEYRDDYLAISSTDGSILGSFNNAADAWYWLLDYDEAGTKRNFYKVFNRSEAIRQGYVNV